MRRKLSMAVLAAAAAGAPASADTIKFSNACQPGERLTVAAVGDLLFHASLQRQALTPTGNYRRFWEPVEHIIQAADMAYGNLEGPAAEGVATGGVEVKDPGKRPDGRVYTARVNEMLFNYHPSVADDIKSSGFDVVSTANNHSADRGSLGIDRTIDALERVKLDFTGTRRRGETSRPWSTVIQNKGFNVAWLACTYGTNNPRAVPDQVLNCYRDKDAVMEELRLLAASPTVDAVMLTPHWGHEGAATPSMKDREYAREAIEAGATAVLGAHPHVLQPMEKVVTASGREGLVVYSMGNFISNQPWLPNRSGVIILFELFRSPGTKARITATGFVPTYVDRDHRGHRVTELRPGDRGKGGALALTLKRLPPGNRVMSEELHALPRDCVLPAEVATAPPAPAGAQSTGADPSAPAAPAATAPPAVAPDAAVVTPAAASTVAPAAAAASTLPAVVPQAAQAATAEIDQPAPAASSVEDKPKPRQRTPRRKPQSDFWSWP